MSFEGFLFTAARCINPAGPDELDNMLKLTRIEPGAMAPADIDNHPGNPSEIHAVH